MIIINVFSSNHTAINKLIQIQYKLHDSYSAISEGSGLTQRVCLKDINSQDDLFALCELANVDIKDISFYCL